MTNRITLVTTSILSVTGVLQNANMRNDCITNRITLVTTSILSVTDVLQNANMRNTLVTNCILSVTSVIRLSEGNREKREMKR
jgi:hypothetical protein